jgi:hypothetical protein
MVKVKGQMRDIYRLRMISKLKSEKLMKHQNLYAKKTQVSE